MINDHTDRYNAPAWQKTTQSQRIFARKNRPRVGTRPMLWKTVGALILIVLILGVGSTLWFGNQIRAALDEIGKAREIQTELVTENNELRAQREHLLDRRHIEAVAKRLGLYPPGAGQRRTP